MMDTPASHDVLLRYVDGTLRPGEDMGVADLLRRDPEARAFLRMVAEQAVAAADMERSEHSRHEEATARHEWHGRAHAGPAQATVPRRGFGQRHWAAAAAAALLVLIGVLVLRPGRREPDIARVIELSGGVQWTGTGGRVIRAMEPGTPLPGGTLESLSAESWGTLEFRDGSTVTISGPSVLTLSDLGQKEMHLRTGSLSGHVMPQPPGKPLLIHTPTAEIEVLGTHLTVDVSAESTVLAVQQGRVRLTRLVDQCVVEVPAACEVTASADRQAVLGVTRRPEAVGIWHSNMSNDRLHGTWVPDPDSRHGALRAAPMVWRQSEKPTTLYVAVLAVSRNQPTPVVLATASTIHVRGTIGSSGVVTFGLTTKHPKGGFAGKFVAHRQFATGPGKADTLDTILRLDDFQLLPSERSAACRAALPASAAGLELLDWWCCSGDADLGVSIESVELLPTEAPPVSPPPPPVAAESLGDVLRQSGYSRMIGTWVDAETQGERYRTTYAWRFPGETLEVTGQEDARETAALMGLHPKTGEIYYFLTGNDGSTCRGTWRFEKAGAVLDLNSNGDSEKEGPQQIRYGLKDDNTMIVTIVGARPESITLIRKLDSQRKEEIK